MAFAFGFTLFIICLCCCLNCAPATNTNTNNNNNNNNDDDDKEQKVVDDNAPAKTQPADIQQTYVIDEDGVDTLVEDAIDYSHKVFLVTRVPDQPHRSDKSVFAPFTLFPSPYPREIFKQAVDVTKAMSLLYFRISRDLDFLKHAYKDVAESDLSIRRYLDLCEEVLKEGIKQPLALYLQRSDYFVHVNTEGHNELKQIEVNGGSVGGANGLGPRVTEIHERVLKKAGITNLPENVLPRNPNAKAGAAKALIDAWRRFKNPSAVIVFLVLKARSFWHFLKRYDEYEIERLSNNKIKVVHLTIGECARDMTMDDNFTLLLRGEPVAVVYTNIVLTGAAASMPPKIFDAIKLIERSTAIKSPSIFYELSITKKVQQMLSLPGMVERFFPNPEEAPMVSAIRKTFAKMWALENDDQETREIVEDAIAHPDRYVLKPNREGGGKNFWGQQIVEKMQSLTPKQRAGYILMEKLNPLIVKNYLVWPKGDAIYDEAIAELGMYGFMVGNMVDGTVPYFDHPGHLVRTKLASSNEGGISTGSGTFDSVYLY